MNENQDPMNELFTSMERLLQLIIEHKGTFNASQDLSEMVEKLSENVNDFKEKGGKFVKAFDACSEILREKTQSSSDKVKHTEKRMDPILRDSNLVLDAIEMAKKDEGTKVVESSDPHENKKSGKDRRKIFKSIGGDKKWIPM